MRNAVIIGAGFYGLMLATFLAKKYNVTIYEETDDVMTKASSLCQMRIHTGMMYPKNLQTALSCVKTFKPFMLKFKKAIVDDFESIYAIAKDGNITTEEFKHSQKLLGSKCKEIKNEFFDPNLVDSVFKCNEFTFEPNIIKQILLDKCSKLNVKILFNHKINNLKEIKADKIFLCNYNNINTILKNSNYKTINNFTVIPFEKIFAYDNLGREAITIIDGNYFSSMCLKDTDLKTYTGAELSQVTETNYKKVFERVKKYIPEIELKYDHSQFGVKTFIKGTRTCHIEKVDENIYAILGGKITNVFNMFEELKFL